MTFFIAFLYTANPQSCRANPSASESLLETSAERSRPKRAFRRFPTSRIESTAPEIDIGERELGVEIECPTSSASPVGGIQELTSDRMIWLSVEEAGANNTSMQLIFTPNSVQRLLKPLFQIGLTSRNFPTDLDNWRCPVSRTRQLD
jgi:hypothetical protein